MKVGDLVRITDGSCAIRIDDFTQVQIDAIGLSLDNFKILRFIHSYAKLMRHKVHDVIIQNTVNKRIYLHSKAYIKVVKIKEVKEITIGELERMYGCKIKIVNTPFDFINL